MPFPNFFVVGAPKCGTTALIEYLRPHPGVFIPATKEPGYFLVGTDLGGLRPTERTRPDYERIFRNVGPEQSAVGEGTVWYLYARGALERIREANPEARIVVLVRRYDEYLHSLHNQLVFNQLEDVRDFPEAWELQGERRMGRSLPAFCPAPSVLQYGEVGRIGEQLKRALSVFPESQVHTVVFDDLIRDPSGVYLQVLSFLGLEDDGRKDFPVVNANRVFRVPRLGAFYKTTALPARIAWNRLKRAVGLDQSFPVGPLLMKALSRHERRAPLPHDFRARLLNEFGADARLLSNLLGRDLTHWVRP